MSLSMKGKKYVFLRLYPKFYQAIQKKITLAFLFENIPFTDLYLLTCINILLDIRFRFHVETFIGFCRNLNNLY